MKRLTWQEWKDLGTEWKTRKFGAGEKDGICADHGRQTVSIIGPNGWIDTGFCATDMNRLQRAVVKTAAAMKGAVK